MSDRMEALEFLIFWIVVTVVCSYLIGHGIEVLIETLTKTEVPWGVFDRIFMGLWIFILAILVSR